MTTIVASVHEYGAFMAADTMIGCGDRIFPGSVCKIATGGGIWAGAAAGAVSMVGVVAAALGRCPSGSPQQITDVFVDELERFKSRGPENLGGFDAVFVSSEHGIWQFDETLSAAKVDRPVFAVGSGADWATGALEMSLAHGLPAVEMDMRNAVSIASRYDKGTGRNVTVWSKEDGWKECPAT